jgi:hypothetical protein
MGQARTDLISSVCLDGDEKTVRLTVQTVMENGPTAASEFKI